MSTEGGVRVVEEYHRDGPASFRPSTRSTGGGRLRLRREARADAHARACLPRRQSRIRPRAGASLIYPGRPQ
ncbi:hypothetical protein ACFYN5_07215 [Streptomyces sp. NPDC007126]|uniref:hypothetical protein n=1 Tax=Streptomyces sp. NPDC007126 TaxID=3364774 RepID=UPI0036CD1F53